jgi:hypothetical protein
MKRILSKNEKMSNGKAEIPGSSIPPMDDLVKNPPSRWQRKKLQMQGAQNLKLAARHIQLSASPPLLFGFLFPLDRTFGFGYTDG